MRNSPLTKLFKYSISSVACVVSWEYDKTCKVFFSHLESWVTFYLLEVFFIIPNPIGGLNIKWLSIESEFQCQFGNYIKFNLDLENWIAAKIKFSTEFNPSSGWKMIHISKWVEYQVLFTTLILHFFDLTC